MTVLSEGFGIICDKDGSDQETPLHHHPGSFGVLGLGTKVVYDYHPC